MNVVECAVERLLEVFLVEVAAHFETEWAVLLCQKALDLMLFLTGSIKATTASKFIGGAVG